MDLLERDDALGSLVKHAAAARAGEGRLVLVAGEAGVGKTSLLEALRTRVTDARWLWGSCDGSFTPQPLGPLFDIAAQVGGELAAACAADASRDRLFRLLLADLAESPTWTVVVLEDVHWADESTLDLLSFLTRRIRATATLLLATYRDDGLSSEHRLARTVGELCRQRPTARMTLPPLSESAVGLLAWGSGFEPFDLHRLTGGNPFYVTELLAAGPNHLPQSARDAVLARLARLSDRGRRLVEAAAVVGSKVEVELLRDVAGPHMDAIDECLSEGVLCSDVDSFRFRHEIARDAVEAALPAHRHRDLHRRALEALSALGVTDDARLAHHAVGAGDAAAVVHHALRAARRASELSSHREAVAQYERARGFAAGLPAVERAALNSDLASECGYVERWEQSAEAAETALDLWRQVGDDLRVGSTLLLLSRAMFRLGRGKECDAASAEAVAVLERRGPSAELASAYAARAFSLFGKDDDEALVMARRARVLAEDTQAHEALSDALNTEGCVLMNLGQDGMPQVRRALDVAITAGSGFYAGRAFANLHTTLLEQYRFAEAESTFAEGVAYADELDLGVYSTCLHGGHARMLAKQGRWEEAEALCVEMLARSEVSPVNRLNFLDALGIIYARRGQHDAASPVLSEALATAEGMTNRGWYVQAVLSRLEATWLAGDQARAVEQAHAVLDIVRKDGPESRGALAAWLRRLGDTGAELSDLADPYSRQIAGDWHGAASVWRARGCPFDAALALLDSNDEKGVTEALRLFDQLGATAAVPHAQSALRRLGLTVIPRGRRPATRTDRFGLTAREQEVLAALRDGGTNADIAARLFISEKTVDHHVSSVLAKMGVRSRRDAVRTAEQADEAAALPARPVALRRGDRTG